MKIKFMGATGRVTGSCFLLQAEGKNIIIDCGLFQGDSASRGKNHEPFTFDPRKVDAVIATHSHVDHIGRIPKLFRDDFRGPVYSTKPVKDFAKIFLEDTLKLMKGETRRKPEHEMLWDKVDLDNALSAWSSYDYHVPFNIGGISVEFLDAGHILGSAIVRIIAEGKTIIFSGDIGNPPAPILEDTEMIDKADYLIIETTYGNRTHEKSEERLAKLEAILKEVENKRGVLLIPAFAMEKTQELLYELNNLFNQKRINKIAFFIDSPLAIKATEIYIKYENYFDDEAKKVIKYDKDIFDFPGLTICRTTKESLAIQKASNPKVIMAGSGMSTGGRIIMHEQMYLPDPNNIILFVGYQVKGTLGRRIKDGEKNVNIYGKEIEVRAEVRELSAYSSHADQPKLMSFIKNIQDKKNKITKVFAVHGEPDVSEEFAQKVRTELGVDIYAPKENEEITL